MAPAQPPDQASPATARPGDDPGAKQQLRRRLLAARRTRPAAERDAVARAVAAHLLATAEVRRARTVAAYVALGTEPGTSALLDALRSRGVTVILPVLLPDGDLDWATYAGPGTLVDGRLGLGEPGVDRSPRLGVGAVAAADVVLVPGLAVSPTGLRLGRGGGSYDRALARLAGSGTGVAALTCVLLHDEEVGLDVPGEPHDRRVEAVVSPRGLHRFTDRTV